MDLQLLNYSLIAWPLWSDTQGVFMVHGDIQNKAKQQIQWRLQFTQEGKADHMKNKVVMVTYSLFTNLWVVCVALKYPPCPISLFETHRNTAYLQEEE